MASSRRPDTPRSPLPPISRKALQNEAPRELRRFLDISLGSFAELRYILRLAHDLGYLSAESGQALEPLIELAGRLLWGLYRSIQA